MDKEAIKDLVNTAIGATSGRISDVILYLTGQDLDSMGISVSFLLDYLLARTRQYDADYNTACILEVFNGTE